ncbi:MAG: hypothetical protein HYR51_20720 [Candidatus Rokubacteria bacterium]|nr:hypothetical protein [Candidatus Rokubacteria bacterium]
MSPDPTPPLAATTALDRTENAATEGVVAGLIGAGTVAVWFLLLDTFAGRPFYTPSLLGTALFRRGVPLETAVTAPVSLEMVGMFTWVHALVFIALGGAASYLLTAVETRPSLGFGLVLLFVVFQAGFTVVAVVIAPALLAAVGWIPVLTANLLAASAMAGYFAWRHRTMSIAP